MEQETAAGNAWSLEKHRVCESYPSNGVIWSDKALFYAPGHPKYASRFVFARKYPVISAEMQEKGLHREMTTLFVMKFDVLAAKSVPKQLIGLT